LKPKRRQSFQTEFANSKITAVRTAEYRRFQTQSRRRCSSRFAVLTSCSDSNIAFAHGTTQALIIQRLGLLLDLSGLSCMKRCCRAEVVLPNDFSVFPWLSWRLLAQLLFCWHQSRWQLLRRIRSQRSRRLVRALDRRC
jgi:hypothetical protein